jgi:hypothetical protein
MLVRELMEQLAEMPPELPVWTCLNDRLWVEVVFAGRGGRQVLPGTYLWLDERRMADLEVVELDPYPVIND